MTSYINGYLESKYECSEKGAMYCFYVHYGRKGPFRPVSRRTRIESHCRGLESDRL